MTTTIFGKHLRTVFRDEETGFTIFKLKLNEFIPGFDSNRITCKGIISYSLICLPLKLTGKITNDKYGVSFSFDIAEAAVSSEEEAVEFLSSDSFKGISKKTAKKIVEKYGTDIFNLPDTPESYKSLTSIEGIGTGRAQTIIKTLSAGKVNKEVYSYVQKFTTNLNAIERLVKKYKDEALDKLKNSPYDVGSDIGLSFLACDMIARDNDFDVEDITRIQKLVVTTLNEDYYVNANTCIGLYALYEAVLKNSKNNSAFPSYEIGFDTLIDTINQLDFIEITDDNKLQLPKAHSDEFRIARHVYRLQSKMKNTLDIPGIIAKTQEELGIEYSQKQKDCFNFLRSNGVKIITGGPGTGKSTVINGLTHAYSQLYPKKKIVMMAPTGRAAQRMSEITGREAGTIHRMLGIHPFEEDLQTRYSQDYKADFLIVDESSMLDNELSALLLSSIKKGTLVLFVGDIDQLPSIGAGTVLKDLIEAGIETVKLDVTYRQKDKSLIIENANKINSGDAEFASDENFKIITCDDAEEIFDTAIELFKEKYERNACYNLQMLAPQRSGKAGIEALNKAAQDSQRQGPVCLKAGKNRDFYKGDKIMATINNYDIGYFNGDIGTLYDSDDYNFMVSFNGEIKTVPKEFIGDFQLAYATTVHKSQGSEYDSVIICMPKEAMGMMQRNLLYTAVTRAKKEVIIITEPGVIAYSAQNNRISERRSNLQNQLKSFGFMGGDKK